MSSSNQYDPQRQYPQHPQYGQGQYDQRPAAPGRAIDDDDLVAIPMKKSNPVTLLAIAGGAVLVIGVAAFSFFGGKKSAAPAPAATSTVSQAEQAEKAKALKEHLEITQRSLAKMKEAEAAQGAATKAQAEQAQAQAPQAQAQAASPSEPRTHTSARSHTAVAAAPAPAPAPRPVNKVASKKKMDSLDDMGAGISSALGK